MAKGKSRGAGDQIQTILEDAIKERKYIKGWPKNKSSKSLFVSEAA
jgi:hypothetical protein